MSSGNLTADRRFAYGQMLRDSGELLEAAEVLAQALELAPRWAEGRFALAEALADAGQADAAAQAYQTYLELDPADSMGAVVRLALLAKTPAPDALPDAYVRRLFDDYAPRFDAALVERLAYRAPQALHEAVARLAPAHQLAATLDLGCGTGLAGQAIRPMTQWLEGVDLSPRMVAEAQRKNIYDHLVAANMLDHLQARQRSFDLMIAADVLVYFGALDTLMQAARARLTDQGLFAFTVQDHDGDGFVLGAEHRYRHSRGYIAATATAAGFNIMHITDGVFRQEKGVDVPGLLVVMQPA